MGAGGGHLRGDDPQAPEVSDMRGDDHSETGMGHGAGRDPAWRREMRRCTKCRQMDPPLIHYDPEGGWAHPLFHEEGNTDAEVLFIVEAPNYADTYDPTKQRLTVRPDTDPSGRFFDHILRHVLGLKPEDVYVTNAVLCLPRKRKGRYYVLPALVQACSENLRRILVEVDPKVVVTQGRKALHAIKNIERHRLEFKEAVAKPHEWFGRILFPVYHTSALARVTRSARQQEEDYAKLRELLQELGCFVRPLPAT